MYSKSIKRVIKYAALILLDISAGVVLLWLAIILVLQYAFIQSAFRPMLPLEIVFIFLPLFIAGTFLISIILFACINSKMEIEKVKRIKRVSKILLILGASGCLAFLIMYAIVLGTGKWFDDWFQVKFIEEVGIIKR